MSQRVTQRFGRALIEKYAHLCGSECTSRDVIKHGPNLFGSDAGKPFDELCYESAVLEIFK